MNIKSENLMTITADALRKHPPESGFLRGEVRRYIREIETAIREAQRVKDDSVRHELATNFPVTKISNRDAQTYVYSSIIDQLKLNGFTVKLFLTGNSCHIVVRWSIATADDEVRRQREIIDSVLAD